MSHQQNSPTTSTRSLSGRTGRIGRWAVAAVAAALLAGCAATPPVHYTPSDITQLPAGSLSRAWLAELPLNKGEALERLVVQGDRLYAFSNSRGVTAMNRTAGTIAFAIHVNSRSPRILSPVPLADRLVFPTVVSLEVYDKQGHFLRSVPLSTPLGSGATGLGDTIYFGADSPNGGRLVAEDLSRSFNTVRWTLATSGGAILGAPASLLGNIYFGTDRGEVYAVNASRNPVWDIANHIFTVGDAVVADIKTDEPGTTADQANVYVACKDTKLYAVSALTGKLRWQFFSGVPLYDPPVVCRDIIYQFVPGVGIAAIEKTTGQFDRPPRWVFKGATQFLAEDDRYAYLLKPGVADAGKKFPWGRKTRKTNTILAVDKQTGRMAFSSKHNDFTFFGSNATDNLIYAGYASGDVLAIQPQLEPGRMGELVLNVVKVAVKRG